ncbi:hypothetical protein BV898_07734 [Hypsibius exemplaris]|uniref:Receptor ligand binding region domain-containing protein n=1 Tax=Hypsibius exemplaris TaxID=2072580 RepID=A0A1W0WSH3_HYPEX|nr:hypothetical protein BV898_07734 [Hypsibius exemplaris]
MLDQNFIFIFIIIIIIVRAGVLDSRILNVKIITPTLMNAKLIGFLPMIGPGFESALEDVRRDFPFLNVSQEMIIPPGSDLMENCEDGENDDEVARYYYRQRRRRDVTDEDDDRSTWTLFILGGCGKSLGGIQQIGAGLDKIVVSCGLSSPLVADKVAYPTLLTTATVPSSPTFFITLLKLVRFYNWTTVTVVAELGGHPAYENGGRAIFRLISSNTIRPRIDATFVSSNITGKVSNDVIVGILQRFKATSRALTQPFSGSRLRNISDAYNFEEARKSYSSCVVIGLELDRDFNGGLLAVERHPFVDVESPIQGQI